MNCEFTFPTPRSPPSFLFCSWVDASSSPAKFFVTSQFLTLSYLTVASFATQQHAAQVDWTDTLLGGGDINPFHPYIAGNAVTSSRMMVCVTSPTQGCFSLAVATGGKPTVTTLLADVFLDAYAFGGVASGVANAEVAFGISVQPATVVYRRTTAGTSSFAQISSTGLPASFSLCAPILALNPTNYNEVLLTGIPGTPMATSQVYLSSNFGSSFTSISGNLFAISGAAYDFNGQCTLIVNLAGGERAYLVGTFQGVFVAYSSVPSLWKRLGEKAEFPSVIVTQMRHYPATDLLLVATMGRSVWTIGGATGAAGASAILAALKTNACPAPKTLRPVFCAPGTMLVSSACVSCVADTYSATIGVIFCILSVLFVFLQHMSPQCRFLLLFHLSTQSCTFNRCGDVCAVPARNDQYWWCLGLHALSRHGARAAQLSHCLAQCHAHCLFFCCTLAADMRNQREHFQRHRLRISVCLAQYDVPSV